MTEVPAQTVGPFATTPSQRVDRVVVDRVTGTASIVVGTDGSFMPPAIPTGRLPVARIHLLSTTAEITNEIIVDERALCDLSPASVQVVCRADMNGVNQSIASGSGVVINLVNAPINVGGGFDTANKQFRPNVAGNYLITAALMYQSLSAGSQIGVIIAKNGVNHGSVQPNLPGPNGAVSVTDIVDLNGTTDYVDLRGFIATGGSGTVVGLSHVSFFAATYLN